MNKKTETSTSKAKAGTKPALRDLTPRKDAKGGGKGSVTDTGIGSAKVTGVTSSSGDPGI